MDADQVIRNFQIFLKNSWSAVENAFKGNGDSLEFQESANDWLQANWEILVEYIIFKNTNSFLEVYGDGADCNSDSSRVFLPHALPTHRIICRPIIGNTAKDLLNNSLIRPEEFQFDGFVFWNNGQYGMGPPFDHVLLTGFEEKIVVPANQIKFYAEPINKLVSGNN